MINTREEAVAAYLKDRMSVQTLDGPMGWVFPSWLELDPKHLFVPDHWRFTPRPVPPGDLTWEEAKAAQAAGKKVQWFDGDEAEWRNQIADFTVGHHAIDLKCAWRLKPEPKLVPLGPEDVPPGSVIRSPGVSGWGAVVGIRSEGGRFDGVWLVSPEGTTIRTLEDLMDSEISTDAGKSWRPCSKPEVAS